MSSRVDLNCHYFEIQDEMNAVSKLLGLPGGNVFGY